MPISRSGFRVLSTALLSFALVALGVPVAAVAAQSAVAALPSACVQSSPLGTVSCTYLSTDASQSFVVPPGVTQVAVVATGAPGTDGQSFYTGPVPGGAGATASANVDVVPGATLHVEVGGTSGYNGGGSGTSWGVRYTGNGGGASDVRTLPRTDPATLGSRLVVAGGGGGGGGEGYTLGLTSTTPLGGTGGAAGQPGGLGGSSSSYQRGEGGGTGTAAAGGAAGPGVRTGTDGSLGQGGLGAGYGAGAGGGDYGGGGGGGGGGWYGGGGGGSGTGFVNSSGGGGGGGGSSQVPAGGTTGTAAAGTAASVVISYQPVGTVSALRLLPGTTTSPAGAGVTFQVVGVDADGTGLENLTSSATLTIGPDGTCSAATCTPALPGGHTVTATVGGLSTTATISATLVSPTFTGNYPFGGIVVGMPYTYTFTATGIPAPTFRIGSGSLPLGLALDGVTGAVSGTPTTIGISTFTVVADNGGTPATTPRLRLSVISQAGCTQPLVAGVVTCVFNPTSSQQTWSVPTGVTSADITAVGGDGGDGADGWDGSTTGGAGGAGATAEATIAVTPASTLFVMVGTPGGLGGFNGGGYTFFGGMGGGGGASDVRTVSWNDAGTLASRLVVAAGGGGGGGAMQPGPNAQNGSAGGAAGAPGTSQFGFGDAQPGTATAGGAGGLGFSGTPGQPGELGTGGPSFGTGGGGGGGLYGGGSGAGSSGYPGGAGGAGGSSYAPGGSTGIAARIPPSVTIGYQPPLGLTPATTAATVGTPVDFTVNGQNATGAAIDVTSAAVLTISPDGVCSGDTCTPASSGVHTVTATLRNLTAQATITVPDPAVRLSSSSITAGDTITVFGTNFPAGVTIDIELHSTPVTLATVTTSTIGTFAQQVTIPAGTAPGAHLIVVAGTTSAALTVTAPFVVGSLSLTGRDVSSLGAAAALLLGIGVVLVLLRPRRRATRAAD